MNRNSFICKIQEIITVIEIHDLVRKNFRSSTSRESKSSIRGVRKSLVLSSPKNAFHFEIVDEQ